MEESLLIGDHLLVDKLAYSPHGSLDSYLLPYQDVQRGDIIVFRYPMDLAQTFVKRVIGVPGDRVRLVDKKLILNGKPIDEPYVIHRTGLYRSLPRQFSRPTEYACARTGAHDAPGECRER